MLKSRTMWPFACLIVLVSGGCGGRVESSPPCSEVAAIRGAAELDEEGWVLGKEALNGAWLLQIRSKGASEWSPPVPIQWEITRFLLVARGSDKAVLVFPITAHPELGRDAHERTCVLPYPRCPSGNVIEEEWDCEGWYERTGVAVDWSMEISASQPLADLVSSEGGQIEPLRREDPGLVLTSPERLSQIDVTISYQVADNSRVEEVELMLRREPGSTSP